jgi:hypothetical protein
VDVLDQFFQTRFVFPIQPDVWRDGCTLLVHDVIDRRESRHQFRPRISREDGIARIRDQNQQRSPFPFQALQAFGVRGQ